MVFQISNVTALMVVLVNVSLFFGWYYFYCSYIFQFALVQLGGVDLLASPGYLFFSHGGQQVNNIIMIPYVKSPSARTLTGYIFSFGL